MATLEGERRYVRSLARKDLEDALGKVAHKVTPRGPSQAGAEQESVWALKPAEALTFSDVQDALHHLAHAARRMAYQADQEPCCDLEARCLPRA